MTKLAKFRQIGQFRQQNFVKSTIFITTHISFILYQSCHCSPEQAYHKADMALVQLSYYLSFYWVIPCSSAIILIIRYILNYNCQSMFASAWRHKYTSVRLLSNLSMTRKASSVSQSHIWPLTEKDIVLNLPTNLISIHHRRNCCLIVTITSLKNDFTSKLQTNMQN